MTLREVKQQFFALRNGLLADNLRKQCGLPHHYIFGLNLPQLKEVAATCGKDRGLADLLWADSDCRESRLTAPLVCPHDDIPASWLGEVRSVEEADILCHSLMRFHTHAAGLASELLEQESPLGRYTALRLILNLDDNDRRTLLPRVLRTAPHALLNPLIRQIADSLTPAATW